MKSWNPTTRFFLLFAMLGTPSLPADEAALRIEDYRRSCERIELDLQSVRQRTEELKATFAALEESKARSAGLEKETERLKAECLALLETREQAVAAAAKKVSAIRDAKTGTDLGTFQTKSGKSYPGATVRSVVAEGLRIAHADGANLIPKADLPDDTYRAFGFALQDAIEAATQRTLPDLSGIGILTDAAGSPRIKSREEILAEERQLTDAERFVNAQSAQATFKRAEAKAILSKAQPGSEAHKKAQKLIEEAREIEQRLGLPDPGNP